MKKIIRNENGYTKVVTVNDEPSKTQKHMAHECDINAIMKKYHNGQMITHLARKAGQYADLTQLPDYQTALNTVIAADAAFMTIPSQIRARFSNDPQLLMDFLKDPNNKQEAIQLGLIPQPQPVLSENQNDLNEQKSSPKPKQPKQPIE